MLLSAGADMVLGIADEPAVGDLAGVDISHMTLSSWPNIFERFTRVYLGRGRALFALAG